MKNKITSLVLALATAFGLFLISSCDNSSGNHPEEKQKFTVKAFIHDNDGKVIEVRGEDLRASQIQNGAEITGLGSYYHNQQCELGINPVKSSNKEVDYVIFDKGSLQPTNVLPTTKYEYQLRTKPINPYGYSVNFRFAVTADVMMHVYLKELPSGVDVGTE